MEISFWNFIFQLAIGLIGGLGGGLIIGLIEIKRYGREKKAWEKEDQKIELILLSTQSYSDRWQTKSLSDKEKIRIFESGLNGKIHYWQFFVKYEIANLTDQEILVHSVSLEFSRPQMIKPQKEDKKYFTGYKKQILERYNLITKEIIHDIDFPLKLPAHSNTGIVFVGDNEYDYPNLLEAVPATGTLRVVVDNSIPIEQLFNFNDIQAREDFNEIDEEQAGSAIHWIPYMEKNGIEYGIPF